MMFDDGSVCPQTGNRRYFWASPKMTRDFSLSAQLSDFFNRDPNREIIVDEESPFIYFHACCPLKSSDDGIVKASSDPPILTTTQPQEMSGVQLSDVRSPSRSVEVITSPLQVGPLSTNGEQHTSTHQSMQTMAKVHGRMTSGWSI